MPSVYTDLALEAHEALGKPRLPGVRVEEKKLQDGIQVTRVEVVDEVGAQRLGKPIGHYVTVESKKLRRHDREHAAKVGKAVSKEITAFITPQEIQKVMVVGLGNWKATPDALGPRVVGRVLVTRHLKGLLDEEVDKGLRTVTAIAPGVLGLTGVETSEIVHGVASRTEPDMIVAIDSLAASSIDRIGTTIQISDAGIHPGSGVGNRRSGLTKEIMGIPVVAIGVPTVVHAMTIAKDTVTALTDRLKRDGKYAGTLSELEQIVQEQGLFEEVLGHAIGELVVSPKEIDVMIEDLSRLIAGALNTALHPGIDLGEFSLYA